MKTSTFFHVVYDGPALDSNEMDVRDLAPALLALGSAIEGANRVLNQGRAQVAVKVKGSFKTGCFGIDLAVVQGLSQSLVNFMNSDGVVAGATLLGYLGFVGVTGAGAAKGLVQLLKWLGARRLESVDLRGTVAVVRTEDGDRVEVAKEVVSLLQDYDIRKGLEAAIKAPLQSGGVTSVAFAAGGLNSADRIEAQDAEAFTVPEPEDEVLPDSTIEAVLRLISISFQERNKWRVSDGTNTFYADVLDEEFLAMVGRNEVAFAKDDRIRALVRTRQTIRGDGLKAEYFIDKVLEHVSASRQLKLPLQR